MTLTHGSLFAGIGGFDLGFERAGIKTIWQVEIDAYCRRVLARHFPAAERFADILDCCGIQGEHHCERKHHLRPVDIVSGGFPCQDESFAGKRAGIEKGERSGLWREYARIIRELSSSGRGPRIVVVENVPGLLSPIRCGKRIEQAAGISRVLGDLAACGYDAEWQSIRASDVGAPHRRERIWIVAHAAGDLWRTSGDSGFFASNGSDSFLANAESVSEEFRTATREPSGRFTSGGDVADAASNAERWTWPTSGKQQITSRGRSSQPAANVADANGAGCGERWRPEPAQQEYDSAESGGEIICNTSSARFYAGAQPIVYRSEESGRPRHGEFKRSDWWAVEPDVGRVAHGIPARVDRLRGLGNAVVPQITEIIGRWLAEALGEKEANAQQS